LPSCCGGGSSGCARFIREFDLGLLFFCGLQPPVLYRH
jgi:hypothetical protein